MSKFIQVFSFFLLLVSNIASATLIESDIDLADDSYITYRDIDWAWVSSVNVENFSTSSRDNTLKAPSYRMSDLNSDGFSWRFANEYELEILVTELTYRAFKLDPNSSIRTMDYIWAIEYWNTDITNGDPLDFINKKVASAWDSGDVQNETFYVRGPELFRPGTNPPTNVPEPTNIAVFGLGLIALAFRKKFN